MITDETFKELIGETGFIADEYTINAFKEYHTLLEEKNKVMNLTAITDYDEVVIKHFIDSLLVNRVINDLKSDGITKISLKGSRITDVGTGAGFPGIPLKIACPESETILIDSLNKRIRFLDEVIEKLELKGITAVHGRCEDIGHDRMFRERFDICFSRAVAALPVLSEYCLPLVKPDGFFIAYKSSDADKEINDAKKAVETLGGEILDFKRIKLPGSDIIRGFCVIQKKGKCPAKYPRQAGTPSKKPL